jgi:hypothetical protein
MAEPACFDLRPWAAANRYRWRFEESYSAEKPENRGDGRWFVEILCQHGLIYPKGGDTLLAYATCGVKRHISQIKGAEHHQSDGKDEVFSFPLERLDDVAAILKPRRRRTLDPDKARAIGKATAYGAQSTESRLELQQDRNSGKSEGEYQSRSFSASGPSLIAGSYASPREP